MRLSVNCGPPDAVITYRVLYADTDMAGVVYHANYLRLFEAARTELLYSLGVDIAALQSELGVLFTIADVALTYHGPAYYGDLLRIEVSVGKVGPARLTLHYAVYRNDTAQPCVTGHTTIATLDVHSGRVVRLPRAMRDAMVAAGAPAGER